jgi:hypothetical protein
MAECEQTADKSADPSVEDEIRQLSRKTHKSTKPGVSIGMTTRQVIENGWGAPLDKHRTTTAAGTSEQWVYGGRQYLYFENDILVSVQN